MTRVFQFCLKFRLAAAIFANITALLVLTGAVQAQNIDQMMQQNQQQMMAFEQQMNARMAQSQAQFEVEMQRYIEQNRASLESEHQQYIQNTGAQISLQEYARAKVMEEAARRNNAANAQSPNPIFAQQQQSFRASQEAYKARQQNFDNYNNNWAQGQQQIDQNNQNWMQNQREMDSQYNRFLQQGIQGNQYYRNTETGQVAELPFAGSPGIYQNGNGDTWNSGSMGQYNQIDPNGMRQEMEVYEPPYYGDD